MKMPCFTSNWLIFNESTKVCHRNINKHEHHHQKEHKRKQVVKCTLIFQSFLELIVIKSESRFKLSAEKVLYITREEGHIPSLKFFPALGYASGGKKFAGWNRPIPPL